MPGWKEFKIQPWSYLIQSTKQIILWEFKLLLSKQTTITGKVVDGSMTD